ncbi:MAG: hypothetical protein ABEI39_06645 [Halobacteriales archaeon]
MALPTGLFPVLVFVLTAGVASLATAGACLLARGRSFGTALGLALRAVGALYLAGTGVVWWLASGIGLWEVAATLLVAGGAALVLSVALPLLVGRAILRRTAGVAPDTALRFAAYGWVVAMVVAFGIFVAPGGFAGGDLLSLGGPRICFAGFCGISLPLVAGAALATAVGVLGPGLVGGAIHAAGARR